MTRVRFQNQLPSFLDSFLNNELDAWSRTNFSDTNTSLPAVNIKENRDAFFVEMAAPGFDKEDFNIELKDDLLTISSEKQIEDELKEDERITRQEYSYQSFIRTFTLPELVEDEKISAKYENGILSIFIPKKEEAKPKPVKQIIVK